MYERFLLPRLSLRLVFNRTEFVFDKLLFGFFFEQYSPRRRVGRRSPGVSVNVQIKNKTSMFSTVTEITGSCRLLANKSNTLRAYYTGVQRCGGNYRTKKTQQKYCLVNVRIGHAENAMPQEHHSANDQLDRAE